MRDEINFLPQILAPDALRERAKILHALVRCIINNAVDRHREDDLVRWQLLMSAGVDAAVGRIAFNSSMLTPRQLKHLSANNDMLEMLFRAMAEEQQNHHGTAWMPDFGRALTDPQFPSLPTFPGQTEPGVPFAYEVAKWNVARSEQRIFALGVFGRLIRTAWRGEDLMKGWSIDAYACLYRLKLGFLKDLLLFGTLLGGTAASYAAVKAAEHCCWSPDGSTNWSVMEYLQADGASVGSYATADEQAFKASVNELVEMHRLNV